MNAKKLAIAVRNLKKDVDEVIEDEDIECSSGSYDLLRDANYLLGVLAHIVDGMPIDKAFGSPGDWGYSTPIGSALASNDSQ